jgi:hypothetical protein
MKPDALAHTPCQWTSAHERRPWCARAGVEKRPDPVHDFLDVTDQRPHREDRLHQQAFLPLTALTPCEVGGSPWGVATFNLKTRERGHHRLFLSQYLQNGGGNRHDDRSSRICAHL